MEQYSNLNVHGKIRQRDAQGTTDDDVVKYETLEGRVPSPIPEASAEGEGMALIVRNTAESGQTPVYEYVFGEAGKVDEVQINGTTIAPTVDPVTGEITSKVANIPKASTSALGVVKIGNDTNISIDSNGVISSPSVSASDSGSGNLVTAVSTGGTGGHTLTITKGIKYSTDVNGTSSSGTYIVQRQSNGQITVPATPAADTDAASKKFVNSSIATNTATFRGTYNAVTDLGNTQSAVDDWTDPPSSSVQTTVTGQIAAQMTAQSITPENNDYVFIGVDQTPVGDAGEDWFWRFKYDGSAWEYEYTLNNSSYTQAQWDAINSGIEASDVTKLDGIEAGAQVNIIETVKVNNTALTVTSKAVDIPAATTSAFGVVEVGSGTALAVSNGVITSLVTASDVEFTDWPEA